MPAIIDPMENKVLRRLYEKGQLTGERTVLSRQMERRFFPLPAWVADRIDNALTQSIEQWAVNFVDAKTLEEVFDPKS